jgi:hypothetical protein
LRYNDNLQGGHELLHLQTNAMITRRKVTPIPITPAVITQVNLLAEQDGMPQGLKIASRTGQILYDSAWIAGVDYREDEDEDEAPDEDEDEAHEEEDEDEAHEDEDEASDDEDDDQYDEMDPDENLALGGPEDIRENEETENENDESDLDQQTDNESINSEDFNPSNATHDEGEDNQDNEEDQSKGPKATVTRSGRVSRPPAKLSLQQNCLSTNATYKHIKVKKSHILWKMQESLRKSYV